jgi:MFS family permease
VSPAAVIAVVLFVALPALIAFGAAGPRTAGRRAALIAGLGLLIATGLIGGAVGGYDYYRHHVGDWRIGVTAVGIGLAAAAGAVVIASLVWLLVDTGDVFGQGRRWVIHFVTFLLAYAGAFIGAGAGYGYRDGGGSVAAAVAVGVASALGAWLAAALLGLLVEIANSLRRLLAAVEQERA